MEMKTVDEQLLFCMSKELTIPEIPAFAEEAIRQLHCLAGNCSLEISGCCQFIYINSDGQPAKPFTLIIGLPVINRKPITQDGVFFFQTEPYTCIYTDHNGSERDVGMAWHRLVDDVLTAGYIPANQCREIYKQWIEPNSEENITELQIGIIGSKV
ncbi:MAG: AraC family transcriptional regulator [Spartobacteria bacterium]|nr:AraC family transcriptional regulator [Spartobacteria bacterium]